MQVPLVQSLTQLAPDSQKTMQVPVVQSSVINEPGLTTMVHVLLAQDGVQFCAHRHDVSVTVLHSGRP